MQEDINQVVYQNSAGFGDQSATMYIPMSGSYYQAMTSDMQMGSAGGGMPEVQGQVIEQQDGTYLLQIGTEKDLRLSGTSLQSTMESEERGSSNMDIKFCQQEMQFLHDNYESAEGSSLPRSIIYNQYVGYCRKIEIEPMNPASLGKLIRLVFAGIKTRRLGTRGNSKYHYYGIRIKPTSNFQGTCEVEAEAEAANERIYPPTTIYSRDAAPAAESDSLTAKQKEHIGFLGDASAVSLEGLAKMTLDDNELLPEGISVDDLANFELFYREHCQDILSIVMVMDLASLPNIWQNFWQNAQLCNDEEEEDSSSMTTDMLHSLCHADCVQKYVREVDYAFYSILVDVLMPEVLRPIPGSMTLVLRNFSKNLEPWIMTSTASRYCRQHGHSEGKFMCAASAFAQMLRRYTALNHLAQAGRTVLQNTVHVSQMLTDLNKVDFTQIQEQAAWVCQCDDVLIYQLEQEIKKTLGQRFNLEQWAKWLDSIIHHILQEHIGTPEFARAARQLILKWSFYSSMIVRDLTLRSASSFGSFHLIRLLFDEYLFYTIEHKVAAATGVSPIAAFGNIKQFIDKNNVEPLPLENYMPPMPQQFHQQASNDNTFSGYQHLVASNVPTVPQGNGAIFKMPSQNVVYQMGGEGGMHMDMDDHNGLIGSNIN